MWIAFLFPWMVLNVSSSAQGHWYSHSCVLSVHFLCPLFLYFDPMIIAHQAFLSMEFSRQEYQSGLPGEDSGDFPKPGIELPSLISSALPGRFFTTEPPGKPFSVWLLVIYWFRRVFIYEGYLHFFNSVNQFDVCILSMSVVGLAMQRKLDFYVVIFIKFFPFGFAICVYAHRSITPSEVKNCFLSVLL